MSGEVRKLKGADISGGGRRIGQVENGPSVGLRLVFVEIFYKLLDPGYG